FPIAFAAVSSQTLGVPGCPADWWLARGSHQARAHREAGAGGPDFPRREAGAAGQHPLRAAKPAARTRPPSVEEKTARRTTAISCRWRAPV
ncbi:MAG: hypothetical protein ACRD15_08920, partial [Vicinamibacterales bacterium]